MIYIVVKESGSYGENYSENVYATIFKFKAKRKLAELKKKASLANKASEELRLYAPEWNSNNPAPPYPSREDHINFPDQELVWVGDRGWMHPAMIAHEKKERAHQVAWSDARNEKIKELAHKYGIDEEDIEEYEDHEYSIQSMI